MKKHALIVGGGVCPPAFLNRFFSELTKDCGDGLFVVACDHGFDALSSCDIRPDLMIGDFDSVEGDLSALKEASKEMITLPTEKDLTDLQAACEEVIKRGYESVTILGATGGRLDHTLGNLALLPFLLKQGVTATIMDEKNRVRYTEDRLTLSKEDSYGKYVSLIPAGGKAEGITLSGFHYPLCNETLYFADTRGVSNEIKDETAEITVSSGGLYVLETTD